MTTSTFTAAEIGIAFPTLGQAMKCLDVEGIVLVQEPDLYCLAIRKATGQVGWIAGSLDLFSAYMFGVQTVPATREGA